jgi:hypothetical protein
VTAPHPELHELLQMADLAPGDERRAHLDRCPRCRNEVVQFRDFMDPADVPAGANADHAERKLAESLSRARHASGMGIDPQAVGRATTSAPSTRRVVPGRARWWDWLVSGGRPAWAAALAVVVVVLVLRSGQSPPPGEPAMRGQGDVVEVELRESRALPQGGVRLAWTPVPRAEGYVVRVLDSGLNEIARRAVTGDSSIVLFPSDVPVAARGTVLGWKVTALSGGGELATSRVAALRLP